MNKKNTLAAAFASALSTLIAIASGVLIPTLDQPDLALPTLVDQLLPPVQLNGSCPGHPAFVNATSRRRWPVALIAPASR